MARMAISLVTVGLAMLAWATVALGALSVVGGQATPTTPGSLAAWIVVAAAFTGLAIRLKRTGAVDALRAPRRR
jgi:hypothetical protein